MSRRFRSGIIGALVVALLVVVVGVVVIIGRQMRRPPLDRLQQALSACDAARSSGAGRLAGNTLAEAEQALKLGQQELQRLNDRWWPFVSYRTADSLLAESIKLSDSARKRSGQRVASRQQTAVQRVRTMADSLETWRKLLDADLDRTDAEVMYRKAKTKMELAEELVARDSYEAAAAYADSVARLMTTMTRDYREHHQSVNGLSAETRKWANETVGYSKKTGETVIVVDKKAHYLYTLKQGRVVDSCACELGFNSGYQKRRAGDGATPEGVYRVSQVKKQSKYYRALLLDYPNDQDRKRFRENVSKGIVPASAKLGGLIEIHGDGGQGKDWTDGCVAVTNAEMDKLMRIAAKGMRVAIVRSWEGR